jgi:hypothetical protein
MSICSGFVISGLRVETKICTWGIYNHWPDAPAPATSVCKQTIRQPKKQFGVSLQMRKIRWLVVGLILALIIGAITFHFWNQIISFLAAALVFGIFAIAAFAGGGLGDDEDEDDEDDEDDDDDDRD